MEIDGVPIQPGIMGTRQNILHAGLVLQIDCRLRQQFLTSYIVRNTWGKKRGMQIPVPVIAFSRAMNVILVSVCAALNYQASNDQHSFTARKLEHSNVC